VKFSGNAPHGESHLTERGSNPARLTSLSLLGQQSFGYGPGAKCPRGNMGAGVVGYLFETAHQAIAPTRQAGAHITIEASALLLASDWRSRGPLVVA